MKVAIGSDHAGFELKEYLKKNLKESGYDLIDVGTDTEASVDYTDFGLKVAKLVSEKAVDRGVLVCGTGGGMSITANKVKGVRAILVQDLYVAMQSRKHLDTNILVLGGRVIGKGLAEALCFDDEWGFHVIGNYYVFVFEESINRRISFFIRYRWQIGML